MIGMTMKTAQAGFLRLGQSEELGRCQHAAVPSQNHLPDSLLATASGLQSAALEEAEVTTRGNNGWRATVAALKPETMMAVTCSAVMTIYIVGRTYVPFSADAVSQDLPQLAKSTTSTALPSSILSWLTFF